MLSGSEIRSIYFIDDHTTVCIRDTKFTNKANAIARSINLFMSLLLRKKKKTQLYMSFLVSLRKV